MYLYYRKISGLKHKNLVKDFVTTSVSGVHHSATVLQHGQSSGGHLTVYGRLLALASSPLTYGNKLV